MIRLIPLFVVSTLVSGLAAQDATEADSRRPVDISSAGLSKAASTAPPSSIGSVTRVFCAEAR